MLKKVGAVVAGLIIGSIVNMAIILVSTVMHPMPEGVTFNDQEGMKDWIENMPASGFVMALLAHQLGTFAGGIVASLITKQRWIIGGAIVGAFFLLGGVMTLFDFAHPTWFAVVDVGLYLPMGVLGAVVGAKLLRPNSNREQHDSEHST